MGKWGTTFSGSKSAWGSFGGESDPWVEKDPYSPEALQKQISNAQTRLKAVGSETNPDDRNWFEKATNLPEKQNWFFDTLDLLSRPGEGVKKLIFDQRNDSSNSAGESFWQGFSGKEKVSGQELARDLNLINDNTGKWGKFAAGLGVDILTDPTNLIPGKAYAAPVQAGAKGLKAGVNALENVDAIAPLVKGTKDALGNMFDPFYKWSPELKDMYQKTNNDIRFQTEESMRNIAKTAKEAGGVNTGTDVGRIMEAPLKQFDEAGNELPRMQRELSADPKVQQAAQGLVQSNDAIRQWAQDSGISVNEIEGYMTHILSAEERKARKLNKPIAIDRGNFGTGQPNKKILNQRELLGSAEDINDQLGRKFFEPNAYFATAIGQKRLIEYGNAVKFRREVLSNPEFAAKYEKGMQLPADHVVIDTNNYKFMKPETADAMGLADEIGGQYVVPKTVKQALDRFQQLTTDEGTKGFVKAWDTATSAWKRAALFSIPYHIRNDIGAKFNNWVGGMSAADIVKYTKDADLEVGNAVFRNKESDLFTEYRKQGLSSSNLSQVEFAKFGEDPEKAIERTIKRTSEPLPKQMAKGVVNPLRWFESSRNVGDFIDQTNRFALYKWAREKLNLSPEKAAEKVREVQFDYGQLTNFERNIAARAIPFYRWMRKNIPFQIQQFANDPRKYNNLNKMRENAQETFGMNDENVPEWMKQQFAFPVTGDGKGSGKFLGLGLPLGDLTKLSSPFKTFTDSLTPLVKLPIELSSNYNLFYNKPIEKFEGQTKDFAGVPLPAKWGYALEQSTGQIGRGLSSYLNKPGQEDMDTKFRMPAMGISSILKDYDAEQARKFQLLAELKRLQDQMDYIEQQTGKRPPTLDELKKVGGL